MYIYICMYIYIYIYRDMVLFCNLSKGDPSLLSTNYFVGNN